MFHAMTSHRAGQPITVQTFSQARGLFSAYALGLSRSRSKSFCSICGPGNSGALQLNALERALTQMEVIAWCIPIGVGTSRRFSR
jgi:hypothetical protein